MTLDFYGGGYIDPDVTPVEVYRNGALLGYTSPRNAEFYTFICETCGRHIDFRESNYRAINNGEHTFCRECGEAYDRQHEVHFCLECGRPFTIEHGVIDPQTTAFICDDCVTDYDYITCRVCGHMGRRADLANGDNICQGCYDATHPVNFIKRYHYKPRAIFHGRDKENTSLHMGIELEIDDGTNVNACSYALHGLDEEQKLFYQKHDGSLSEDGIEIVTHPCSLHYFMHRFPWDAIISVAEQYEYKSHETNTCGLHVHVSRNAFGRNETERDLNIAKVLLVFDRFWDNIVKFSRRKNRALDHYAKKIPRVIYSDENEAEAVEKVKLCKGDQDRYTAVNLCNNNTVEFRVFRGTLNKNTIFATLQFLHNLVQYVRSRSLIEVQNAEWKDIIAQHNYAELNQYLIERDLCEPMKAKQIMCPKIYKVEFIPDVNVVENGCINHASYTLSATRFTRSTRVGIFQRVAILDKAHERIIGFGSISRANDTEIEVGTGLGSFFGPCDRIAIINSDLPMWQGIRPVVYGGLIYACRSMCLNHQKIFVLRHRSAETVYLNEQEGMNNLRMIEAGSTIIHDNKTLNVSYADSTIKAYDEDRMSHYLSPIDYASDSYRPADDSKTTKLSDWWASMTLISPTF